MRVLQDIFTSWTMILTAIAFSLPFCLWFFISGMEQDLQKLCRDTRKTVHVRAPTDCLHFSGC